MLCIKEERTVKNDFTIAHNSTLYQIEQATRAKKVTVEERLDGSMHISYKGQDLRYREITKQPTEDTAEAPLMLQERKPWIPPADHPWKKLFLPKRRKGNSLLLLPKKPDISILVIIGHFYFGLTYPLYVFAYYGTKGYTVNVSLSACCREARNDLPCKRS